jgi:hypothetical protein
MRTSGMGSCIVCSCLALMAMMLSAATRNGAGKTSTAAPQNGQIESDYHRKGAARYAVDTTGQEG